MELKIKNYIGIGGFCFSNLSFGSGLISGNMMQFKDLSLKKGKISKIVNALN